ncbi:MAG: DUF1080 domain-containing protein [Planctomycetes bacterium]|nr:DUF1080 domain-containing protein [Planctomycetota bacterium]
MRKLSYIPILFAVAGLIPLPTMRAGELKLEPGFKLLFNGKNLDGWQPKGKKDKLDGKTEAFKGRFKVENGMLVIDYVMKGNAYIETQAKFADDVRIKFDFNPGEKCNNDLFLRGTKFDIVVDSKSKELKAVKKGEWNTMDVIVTGDKIEHKINGVTARKSKAKAGASTFVLRAEFGAISIKNIRVKQ